MHHNIKASGGNCKKLDSAYILEGQPCAGTDDRGVTVSDVTLARKYDLTVECRDDMEDVTESVRDSASSTNHHMLQWIQVCCGVLHRWICVQDGKMTNFLPRCCGALCAEDSQTHPFIKLTVVFRNLLLTLLLSVQKLITTSGRFCRSQTTDCPNVQGFHRWLQQQFFHSFTTKCLPPWATMTWTRPWRKIISWSSLRKFHSATQKSSSTFWQKQKLMCRQGSKSENKSQYWYCSNISELMTIRL